MKLEKTKNQNEKSKNKCSGVYYVDKSPQNCYTSSKRNHLKIKHLLNHWSITFFSNFGIVLRFKGLVLGQMLDNDICVISKRSNCRIAKASSYPKTNKNHIANSLVVSFSNFYFHFVFFDKCACAYICKVD